MKKWSPLIIGVLFGLLLLWQSTTLQADTSGTPLQLNIQTFATGLSSPVALAHAGAERMFAVEQGGRIKIVEANGSVPSTPFLDISDRVNSGGEMGLLGLAFHPDYDSNGYFYVNYTSSSGGRHTRISRFTVTANPDVADPASEEILLTINQPYSNHNAGDLHFGPDGYLYIPMGDGGSGGDPDNNAQNLGNLLGSLVRIDVDGGGSNPADCVGNGTGNYTIPADNPFLGQSGACDEAYAYGLRNPWRSAFDSQTGDLFLADVGQNAWEEVSLLPASSSGGENFGWRCYEATHPYNTSGCGQPSEYTDPIFEYSHSGGHCSISGGRIYRGSEYPNMVGHYIMTDYCSGQFWDITYESDAWQSTVHDEPWQSGGSYVAFGEDVNGELYVVSIGGTIYRLVDESFAPLQAGFDSNTPVELGQPAIFTNTTTGSVAPTGYEWNFGDGSPIVTTTNPTHTYAITGTYTVILTATNGAENSVYEADVDVVTKLVPVEADFAVDEVAVLPNEAVQFNNMSTGPDGLTYLWSFGDGNSSTATNPSHTYTQVGIYAVTLQVTWNDVTRSTMQEVIVYSEREDIGTLGGTLQTDDQSFFLFVPASVVDDPVTLLYIEPMQVNTPEGSVGTPFAIVALRNGARLDSYPFTAPVDVRLTYDDTGWTTEQEASLTLWRDGDAGWETAVCDTPTLNTANNTITVPICELGTFTLGTQSSNYLIYLPFIQ